MQTRPRSQLLALAAAASLLFGAAGRAQIRVRVNDRGPADQSQAALDAGRAALRLNRADEALPQLQNALKLFMQANNSAGAAAARDLIGDIYQRYGQYQTALDNYQTAFDALCGAGQQANANLLLVKIGETHYLAGDSEAARQALARMNQCGGAQGRSNNGDGDGGGHRDAGAAFIPVGAALSLASCAAFSPGGNNDNSANNQQNEQTFGHGPTNSRLPSVRMDLRVVDQDGNPVKGVKAKLESERGANGLLCECTHFTDAAGKVLMDPIHFNNTLKLALEAKGFEPLKIAVNPSDLNQPYKVAMLAKGAAGGANAPGHLASAARALTSAAACFDLYSFFASYGFGELWLGRADFDSNNAQSAAAHYRNVLAVSDDSAPAGKLELARLFRAVARTNLGDIALREGRFADAARLYREAIDGATKDNRPELTWAAERGLGRSLWSLSQQSDPNAERDREDALNAFRQAIKTVETLFAGSLRADEARANFLASTHDLFEDAASAFAESALTAPAASSPVASARPRESFAHASFDPRGQTAQRQPTARRPAARPPAAPAQTPPASRPQTPPAAQGLTGRALAYAAEAFRISEEGRARALLDLIGEAHAEITEGVPADLISRRAENAAKQLEITDILRGVRAAGQAPPQDTVAKLEAELDRLSNEYDSIENQIRVASPRYNSLVRAQPLALAEVQQQVLDDGTALLEYSLGRERSYLFAVTKTGLALYRLPAREQIESQVFELRKQLVPAGARRSIAGIDTPDERTRGLEEDLKAASSGRGLVLGGPAIAPQVVHAYAVAANALYNTAVAPAAAFAGGKRLLVVADGALNFVPFEALVKRADGADYASLDYLVKTNEIVYAPSASVVAAVRAARAASQGENTRGVLVVADPVFDAADARARDKKLPARDDTAQRAALKSAIGDVANLKGAQFRLVRLAGTRNEAEQIAALARTAGDSPDLWLDFDASEANLRGHRLDGYGVIHFATHGLLDTDHPQFTGLALSLVGDAQDDGFLRVGEVFNLRLGSPLVVLSACETGLGKENRGEGVIGLARAFMYAGAPSVSVSLWSVADRSTAELMPDFYKRYLDAGGHTPAAALRAAQQQMIAGKRYSAPFYWAPFVLVGDWK